MANRMSLFYAEPMPMMKTLSKATTNFVMEVKHLFSPSSHFLSSRSHSRRPLQNKSLPLEKTTDCLSTMANVCRIMLETP